MSTVMTSKGQVTIPKAIRDRLGIRPGTTVEFRVAPDGRVMLVKTHGQSVHARRKATRFAALRGSATVRLSTRQIMALTRGED